MMYYRVLPVHTKNPYECVVTIRRAMGFLTRWIASGIPDGAARDAALETHLTAMTDKCEKTCVRPVGVILLSLARGKEAGSGSRGRENGMGNERLIEDEHRFVRTARRRGRRVDADTGNRGRDVFLFRVVVVVVVFVVVANGAGMRTRIE